MILTALNQPFKTIGAAALAANKKKIAKGYKIQPYKQGFAIFEVNEDIEKAKKPKIKMTKPWEANENRWNPDLFRTNKKKPGFRLCFQPLSQVNRLIDQGYKIAQAKDWGTSTSQVDGSLRRNSMVGMEIPEKDALEREAYHSYKTQLQSCTNKEEMMAEADRISREAGSEENLVTVEPDHSL